MDRNDDFDDYDDDDDYSDIGDEQSEQFRAFLSADERAFTGGCGTLVDDLVHEALPQFVDLVDEVFANGWTEEANDIAQELGSDLLHLNEHLAGGFTPVSFYANQDFNTTTYAPAPGRWVVPAVQTWLNLASTEGLNGLLRSRLPWVLPLTLECSGDLGFSSTVTADIAIGRVGDLALFLIERGTLSEEDAGALVLGLGSAEDLRSLAGDLAEMWFDVDADANEDQESATGLHFHVGDDGEAELVDGSLSKWAALMNEQDFSYDWGSAASAAWLMWLSIQVMYRENADLTLTTAEGEEMPMPLMLELEGERFWPFPDLQEDLTLTVDPTDVYRKDSADELGAGDDIHPSDQEDVDAINSGAVTLVALTDIREHSESAPPPLAEIHGEDDDTAFFRAITVPQQFTYGNSLRVNFHASADDDRPSTWNIKPATGNDELSVTASDSFLGPVQAGTGIAYAKIMESLNSAMRYLLVAHLDQKTNSESGEMWARATLSLARTFAAVAVQGLEVVSGEHCRGAVSATMTADISENLTSVTLAGPGGSTVELTGSDLARRDAIYCDLEVLYRGLAFARELTGHAASVMFDTDGEADQFTAEWLPGITVDEHGLTAKIARDRFWGARVGTAQIVP